RVNVQVVEDAAFDLSGQRVATLLNEHKPAGFHAVEFNASGLSSGTYFYKLTAGSFEERKKLLLVK
ncbi:MAG: T9SS type A sorting domain-containing protein, partial [candidate division KSB1 bacterium]